MKYFNKLNKDIKCLKVRVKKLKWNDVMQKSFGKKYRLKRSCISLICRQLLNFELNLRKQNRMRNSLKERNIMTTTRFKEMDPILKENIRKSNEVDSELEPPKKKVKSEEKVHSIKNTNTGIKEFKISVKVNKDVSFKVLDKQDSSKPCHMNFSARTSENESPNNLKNKILSLSFRKVTIPKPETSINVNSFEGFKRNSASPLSNNISDSFRSNNGVDNTKEAPQVGLKNSCQSPANMKRKIHVEPTLPENSNSEKFNANETKCNLNVSSKRNPFNDNDDRKVLEGPERTYCSKSSFSSNWDIEKIKIEKKEPDLHVHHVSDGPSNKRDSSDTISVNPTYESSSSSEDDDNIFGPEEVNKNINPSEFLMCDMHSEDIANSHVNETPMKSQYLQLKSEVRINLYPLREKAVTNTFIYSNNISGICGFKIRLKLRAMKFGGKFGKPSYTTPEVTTDTKVYESEKLETEPECPVKVNGMVGTYLPLQNPFTHSLFLPIIRKEKDYMQGIGKWRLIMEFRKLFKHKEPANYFEKNVKIAYVVSKTKDRISEASKPLNQYKGHSGVVMQSVINSGINKHNVIKSYQSAGVIPLGVNNNGNSGVTKRIPFFNIYNNNLQPSALPPKTGDPLSQSGFSYVVAPSTAGSSAKGAAGSSANLRLPGTPVGRPLQQLNSSVFRPCIYQKILRPVNPYPGAQHIFNRPVAFASVNSPSPSFNMGPRSVFNNGIANSTLSPRVVCSVSGPISGNNNQGFQSNLMPSSSLNGACPPQLRIGVPSQRVVCSGPLTQPPQLIKMSCTPSVIHNNQPMTMVAHSTLQNNSSQLPNENKSSVVNYDADVGEVENLNLPNITKWLEKLLDDDLKCNRKHQDNFDMGVFTTICRYLNAFIAFGFPNTPKTVLNAAHQMIGPRVCCSAHGLERLKESRLLSQINVEGNVNKAQEEMTSFCAVNQYILPNRLKLIPFNRPEYNMIVLKRFIFAVDKATRDVLFPLPAYAVPSDNGNIDKITLVVLISPTFGIGPGLIVFPHSILNRKLRLSLGVSGTLSNSWAVSAHPKGGLTQSMMNEFLNGECLNWITENKLNLGTSYMMVDWWWTSSLSTKELGGIFSTFRELSLQAFFKSHYDPVDICVGTTMERLWGVFTRQWISHSMSLKENDFPVFIFRILRELCFPNRLMAWCRVAGLYPLDLKKACAFTSELDLNS